MLLCKSLPDEFLCHSNAVCLAYTNLSPTLSPQRLQTSSVMENISLILPIFISHLFHIQLTLTRMHQAQENIKRVKRKSNGLWQFECGSRGKSFVSSS